MKQYEVSIAFLSADLNTRSVSFGVGDLVSESTFSDSYLQSLKDSGYITEIGVNQNTIYQEVTPTTVEQVINSIMDSNSPSPEPIIEFEEPIQHFEEPLVQDQHEEIIVIEPKKDDIEVRIAGTFLMSTVAVGLFLVSGYLTVAGYASLFSTNKEIIVSLLIMMEISKFSIATVVINQKILGSYRYILSAFLVILVLLASIGHYGYLSSLHSVNETKNEVQDESLSYTNSRITMLINDKENLQRQYDSFDATAQATRKERLYKSIQPKIDEINLELDRLSKEKMAMISIKDSVSHKESIAMGYTAKLLGMTVDQFASILISLLSIIIDPLVIVLASLSAKMKFLSREYNQKRNLSKI